MFLRIQNDDNNISSKSVLYIYYISSNSTYNSFLPILVQIFILLIRNLKNINILMFLVFHLDVENKCNILMELRSYVTMSMSLMSGRNSELKKTL